MHISSSLLGSLLALPLAVVLALGACTDDKKPDADPFDTLQDCYDDHTGGNEHLPVQEAIVVCCLNHPIAGMKAPTCPAIQADCVTHVRAALDASILSADIDAASLGLVTTRLAPLQIAQPAMPDELGNNPEEWEGRVGRNAPCPCGSGKKYKHCHGQL